MESLVLEKQHLCDLLVEKLKTYVTGDTVVVSVSKESAALAYYLAEKLQVPWEVLSCKEIRDPSNSTKTIGSISSDEIIIHDVSAIPSDFIDHQIQILKHSLLSVNHFFSTITGVHELKYKTVVVVCENLTSYDSVLATLKSINKQRPLKTILVSSIVAPETARLAASSVDGLIFLKMDNSFKARAR